MSLDNDESPVALYRQILRAGLTERFPGTQFSFLPGDITAKILNFGLPSPIDVQVAGRDLQENFAYASKLMAKISRVEEVSHNSSAERTSASVTARTSHRMLFARASSRTTS